MKGSSRNRVIDTTRTKDSDRNRNIKPNKNSIGMRPRNHVEMTKSEMQDMLRKAVENTK